MGIRLEEEAVRPHAGYKLREHVELWRRQTYCLLVDRQREDIRVLHPSEAVILSLLDGELGLNELAYLVSETYRLPWSDARSLVTRVLEEAKPSLTSLSHPELGAHRYDPKTFIFPGFEQRPGDTQPLESPIAVDLVLTRRCNFRCRYCYFGSGPQPPDDLPVRTAIRLINEAADMGVVRVNLAGGEPLLYPQICDIVSAITKRRMIPSFSTNGSLLDDSMVRQLADAGLRRVQVSLDAPTGEAHHFLTRTSDTFELVLSGIHALRAHGISARTRSVVTAHNCHLVAPLIDLLIGLEVERIAIGPELTGSCDANGPKDRGELSDGQLANVRRVVEQKARCHPGHSIVFTNEERPWRGSRDLIRCGNLFVAFVVHPTGEVTPCEKIRGDPYVSYGNVHRSSMQEIWLGAAHQRVLERSVDPSTIDGACSACPLLARCRTGCLNLSKVLVGRYFAKDPRCPGPAEMAS